MAQTIQEIRELAESMWEGCHGCDETDKHMWINGFVTGYLTSKTEQTMAQQTAVEWLVNKIYMVIPNEERNFLEGLKDEAKQMEKGQRIKDYNAGYTDGQCNHINDADNYVNEQEYLTT
jgi:hypothetical protein